MIVSLAVFLPIALVAGDIHDNIFLSHLFENVTEAAEVYPVCELGGSYAIGHSRFCDRYYECIEGKPLLQECLDGLGYVPYIGCKPLHVVDCSTRPYLQPPKGKGNCPRLYGIFNDPRGCGQYFRCENGIAAEGICPKRYMFDDKKKQCRRPLKWETMMCFPSGSHHNEMQQNYDRPEEAHHHTEEEEEAGLNHFLSSFKCPDLSTMHLPFGQHSRHPYPGNCRNFIICLPDGSAKISGCEAGLTFNPITGVCEPERFVSGCKH